MRTWHKWLAGLGVVALLSAGALAQALFTLSLTGSEIVNLALPQGGSGIQTPAYVLRSGENHTLVDTGTTVTTQVAASSGMVLATGAITTWAVNLPTVPYRGQRVIIACPGGNVTTLTLTATLPSGVTLVGSNPTTCLAAATPLGFGWTYSTTNNKWYRYF
jgi:hypothetical protein